MFKQLVIPSVNVSIIISEIPSGRRSSKARNVSISRHFESPRIPLQSIVSRPSPLPNSRPVWYVTKTPHFQAAMCYGWAVYWGQRKELHHFAFLRSYLSLMVDYIKSFDREQSRQHKQSHFTRLIIGWNVTLGDKAWVCICLEGKN